MGTRSTIKFYSENDLETPLVCIYNQWDGYVNGVGYDLAKWLNGKKVINGFSSQTMEEGYANGMGCLAAQYLQEHKKSIGGLYIDSINNVESYNYEVRYIDDKFIIKVNTIFEGSPDELLNFKEYEE